MVDFLRSTRTDFEIAVSGRPVTVAAWTHEPTATGVSSSRPLLMMHGFRGDHHGMDLIAHYLRDHRVIVPDLPGFGRTPANEPGTGLSGYTGFLDAFYDAVGARHGIAPLVVGHSFGSIVVAHWARSRAVDGLVLINPITTPALEGPARAGTLATRLYYQAARLLPHRAAHALLASPLIVRGMSQVMATTRDRGLRRYIHDQHARYFSSFADPDSLAEAFDTSVSYTVTEAAAALTMPVGIVAGTADMIAPISATRSLAENLPNARLLELDGVGHLVHYERPEAAAGFVSAFADDLATGRL